jgi:hypothetical protein
MNLSSWPMTGGIKSYNSSISLLVQPYQTYVDSNERRKSQERKTIKISNMERPDNKELDKVIKANWASCAYHNSKLQKMIMQKNFGVIKF